MVLKADVLSDGWRRTQALLVCSFTSQKAVLGASQSFVFVLH
jgi:hypothetical protein